MLRIELWNIYEKVFLSNDPSIKNKNRAAGELLEDALEGQKTAQKRQRKPQEDKKEDVGRRTKYLKGGSKGQTKGG